MKIKEEHITHLKEPFFKFARDKIKENSFVLDIGAGNGKFSEYCNREDLYLFDGNEQSIKELEKKYKYVFHGYLPSLPFENSFFDVIHCSHVIEHLTPEIFYQSLVEMDRCLKKGGFLIISAPLMWEGFYNDLSHIKPYNPHVISSYLCANNISTHTNDQISSDYQVEKLEFRYRERDLLQHPINTKNDFIIGLFLKLYAALKNRGFKNYEKTGFTIVLRK